MKRLMQVGIGLEVEAVELDDVCVKLEQVLRDALRELQRDGRYSDVKVVGPVAIVVQRAA